MASKAARSIHKKINKDEDKILFLKKQFKNYLSQMITNYLKSCSDFFDNPEIIDQIVFSFKDTIENMDNQEINERALVMSIDIFNTGIIDFANLSIEKASELLKKLEITKE